MTDSGRVEPTTIETGSLTGPRGRDHFSLWSIILIVLTFALQLISNDGDALIAKIAGYHHSSPTVSVSTDSFQELVTIDTYVKQAYAVSLLPTIMQDEISQIEELKKPNGQAPLNAFHSTIQLALDAAVTGLRRSPDSIYFARRVILLRGLMEIAPLEPLPGNGKSHSVVSPLDAYNLAASEVPDEAKQVLREEQFWRTNFSSMNGPTSNLQVRLSELNQFPTLLFYNIIAKQELCLRAGAFAEAKRLNQEVIYKSAKSLGGLGAIELTSVLMLIAGLVVLIGFVNLLVRQRFSELAEKSDGSVFDIFITPQPERIAPTNRKLRAGDLLDCFAIYLALLDGFGTVLGLLLQRIPEQVIHRLSELDLIYLNIALALVSYVGASATALIVLIVRARKLGATLETELGLSKRSAMANIGFGIVGWGASLILVLSVSSIASQLLHSLPAPENPALPMLSFAPNTVTRIALYSLAAIAAPFFEETFFRGVLLNALLLRFRPGIACLITGLMFGGIHPVGISDALSLAALGVVFSWMAYLRKSLAPSMFAHFLQNSYAYLSVYFIFATIVKL